MKPYYWTGIVLRATHINSTYSSQPSCEKILLCVRKDCYLPFRQKLRGGEVKPVTQGSLESHRARVRTQKSRFCALTTMHRAIGKTGVKNINALQNYSDNQEKQNKTKQKPIATEGSGTKLEPLERHPNTYREDPKHG